MCGVNVRSQKLRDIIVGYILVYSIFFLLSCLVFFYFSKRLFVLKFL